LQCDVDSCGGIGWGNKPWLKELVKALGLKSVGLAGNISASRKATSVRRFAEGMHADKLHIGKYSWSHMELLYKLQIAVRSDLLVSTRAVQQWSEYDHTGDKWGKAVLRRWLKLLRQVLSFICIVLLMVAPVNLQQKRAAALVRLNFKFSVFMSCVTEESVDTLQFGFCTYYMWMHHSCYGGITFNYGARDAQHESTGRLVNNAVVGERKSDAFKRDMHSRLYREMALHGVDQFEDVATAMLCIKRPSVINTKSKKRALMQLERVENAYNRWVPCKMNDRGM
jgi:hypothetical protein